MPEDSRDRDAQIENTLLYFVRALAHVEQELRELQYEGVDEAVMDSLRLSEHQLAAVQRHLAGRAVVAR